MAYKLNTCEGRGLIYMPQCYSSLEGVVTACTNVCEIAKILLIHMLIARNDGVVRKRRNAKRRGLLNTVELETPMHLDANMK